MKKRIIFFILYLFVFCEAFSQGVAAFPVCNNQSISLGNDVVFCEGDSVTLNAAGIFDRIVWSNGASTSSIKVKTSGTYIVHGLKASTVDLITNGDFHDTLTTFTSDYLTANGNQPYNRIVNPNYFKIVPTTGDAYWDFDPNCKDHTSGNGTSNMLAVNGYTGLNKKVWCQTVTVQAGKTYNLSAWAASMAGTGKTTSNPARLQFKINNVNVGSVLNLPTTACSWQNFNTNWSSGVATSAQICIYDNVITNSGNDFAIDDISFTINDTCRVSDTVVVTVHPKPVVNLGNDISTCASSATLTVPNTQPSWTYQWSNGSTTNPTTVNTAGTYNVEVTDANGCKNSDNINLSIVSAVKINLGNDTSFCSGGNKLLDAGTGYTSYTWSGAKTGSAQTLVADMAGTYIVNATGACNSSDTIVVSVLSKPIASLGNDITSCSATATLSVANPQPGDSYLWSEGSVVSSILVNASGNYWVQVTNTNNCSARDTANVSLINNANVNLGNDTVLCIGDTKLLNAGTGYLSYFWSGAKTGSSSTLLADVAGTYIVNVSAGLGCTDIDTIVISYNALPNVNLGNDISSCSANVILHAGNNFTSYLWSNTSSDSTLVVNAPGNYWVEVSNALGCKAKDTIAVNIISNLSVNLGPDVAVCAGNLNTFDAGTGFTSYLWSNAATSQTITVSTAGTYIVTVSNGACSASDTVLLTVNNNPNPSLGNDVVLCTGANNIFNAGSFASYLWSDASTSSTLNTANSGIYWVEVTDNNGCKGRDTATLTIQNTLALNLGADKIVCENSSFVFDGGNGYTSYSWSGAKNAPTQTILADVAGNYILSVSSGTCSARDTVALSFFSAPVVDLGADKTVCSGASILLDAGTFATYKWSTSETTKTVNKTAGTYWVEVSDINGCKDTDSIQIINTPNPLIEIGNDVDACDGDVVMIQEQLGTTNLNYDWITNNISVGNTSSIQVTQSGTYTLTVTDANNCTSSDVLTAVFKATPIVNLNGGKDSALVCKGNNLVLDATTNTAGVTYLWLPDKLTSSAITVNKTGDYSVIVNNGSCSDTDAVHVEVITLPKGFLNDSLNANAPNYCFAELTGGVDISAETTDGKIYNYLWSTGATTSVINVNTEGSYSVTISLDNCMQTDKIKLVDYCPTTIFLPSAFSPNGDGVNETFYARGTYVDEYQILIFNRWGELIYESSNFNESWDGTYGSQKVQEDVYVWKVLYTVHEPSGIDSKQEIIGKVVVLR